MRITSINVLNFQCFGPVPTVVKLDDLTVLLGSNGGGKTALMEALMRLFGPTSYHRTILATDFHLPAGKKREDYNSLSLRVEVHFELSSESDQSSRRERAAGYDHLLIDNPDGDPYSRAILEATWTPSSDPEGAIEQSIYWAQTTDEDVPLDKRSPMRAQERSQIRVAYVPAIREPSKELRNVSGTLLNRVFRSVRWSESLPKEMAEASEAVSALLDNQDGMELLQSKIADEWARLYSSSALIDPSVEFAPANLADVLKQASVSFKDGPSSSKIQLDLLSEGQRSLFFLSLTAAVFSLEQEVQRTTPFDGEDPLPGTAGALFDADKLMTPLLTVFAIEEPENHLSPHYLGSIVKLLQELSKSLISQVVLTTHSPSIMSRIEPARVRSVRLQKNRTSRVTQLELPTPMSEMAKFLNEAVLAFPELYFADLVILGEGDSEQIVLPRILAAMEADLDYRRISVVPLGGRFVHHFWRLLRSLDIPMITLLDLDMGRHGGGWGRIKYVCNQLLEGGVAWEALSHGLPDDAGNPSTSHILDALDKRTNFDSMKEWRSRLRNYNVFFSNPLDLDYSMLRAFPSEYKLTADLEETDPTDEEVTESIPRVLKKKGDPTNYTEQQKMLFPAYSELFLKSSKPATHMLALAAIEDASIVAKCPKSLEFLATRANELSRNED